TDLSGTKALGTEVGINAFLPTNVGSNLTITGNLIAGNSADNVRIVLGSGALVQGNLIGTDITGALVLGQNATGVAVSNSAGATIGGTTPAARNIITSGHTLGGLVLGGDAVTFGGGSPDGLLQGNYIGTDITGTKAVTTGTGATLNSNGAVVGGTKPAARN